MGELGKEGKLQRAYGFNPGTSQRDQWSTDPLWQADAINVNLSSEITKYHYLHTDHLGTPIIATDKQGFTTWKYVAEAFGSVKIIEGDAEISLRLPGQYYDYESEGFYNLQRDYKSIAGRYLQQDPLGLSGGLNLYSYASQNPISKYDFLGLADKDMCARCEYKDKPDVCTIMCISLPVTWEVGCWKMELRCGEWNVVGFSTNTWTERPFAMVATFSCEYFDFLRKYPDPKYRPTIA